MYTKLCDWNCQPARDKSFHIRPYIELTATVHRLMEYRVDHVFALSQGSIGTWTEAPTSSGTGTGTDGEIKRGVKKPRLMGESSVSVGTTPLHLIQYVLPVGP